MKPIKDTESYGKLTDLECFINRKEYTLVKDIKPKSTLEWEFANKLVYHGVVAYTEPHKLPVQVMSHYIPDFYIPQLGLHIETKGFLRRTEKQKLKYFRQQYPDVVVLFVFRKQPTLTEQKFLAKHKFTWVTLDKAMPLLNSLLDSDIVNVTNEVIEDAKKATQ